MFPRNKVPIKNKVYNNSFSLFSYIQKSNKTKWYTLKPLTELKNEGKHLEEPYFKIGTPCVSYGKRKYLENILPHIKQGTILNILCNCVTYVTVWSMQLFYLWTVWPTDVSTNKCISRKEHTKYSNVSPMSRIDLTPPQTTATGVCPNSIRSALTSNAK